LPPGWVPVPKGSERAQSMRENGFIMINPAAREALIISKRDSFSTSCR
jgi:hypothetical protein